MKYIVNSLNEVKTNVPGKYVIQDKITKKVKKVITVFGNESRVDESQKDLTDISKLLEPAIQRGLLRHSTQYTDKYDDIPPLTYEDALKTVATADQMFDSLPHAIKMRFKNDTKAFLAYTQDPANAQEMQKLGMLTGNDGLRADGTPSGAPTKTDMNGNGIPDKLSDGSPNPADSPT